MNKYAKHLLAVLVMVALMCTMLVMPAMAADATVTTETDSIAAKIGEVDYPTFAKALTAAAAMTGDVTVEIYDKVTLNTSLSGSYNSIKFVGKDTDAEIYLEVQGYITATGKNVAFENLTLSKSTGGFITNAGFMNVAFGVYEVTEVTYTNCTFANGAYASSGKVTYTGCTFKRSHDKYGLWAYGNVDVTVDSCTFADYRGIKMYAENAAKTTKLTVKNSDFSAVNDKPAIVLTYGKSVTLENNTYSSTGVFELDLDGDPNGVAVTSDVAPSCKNDNGACGVLVDGKIYTTVAQAAAAAPSGSTVTLLHDVTIDSTINIEKDMIIDGNGHSVTFTCHTGFYPSAVNFTLQNITLINNGMPHSGATHPQYVDTRSAANITFDNVTAKAGTQYAVNMRGASSGASLTIKNSNIDAGISGSNTINIWGNNHKIEIINSSLSGRAMYGYHFAVIAFNSDGSNTSNGNSLTIDNSSTLTCTAESGQDGICYPIHIPTSNSNGVSISIASGATINTMDGSEDIIVKNAVVSVGNKYFNNQADAFTAAKSGDTVTLLEDTTVDPYDYLADGLCFKTVDNQYFIGTHKLVGVANETVHWSECLHCGYKTGEVAHTYTLEDVVEAHLKSAATCTSPAVYYKSCSGCGYPSSSDSDTFTHGNPLGHDLTHNEGVPATCTETGVVEHYACSACEKSFSDEAGTTELTTIVINKKAHTEVAVAGKDATCTETGLTEGKKCSVCNTVTVEQTVIDKKAHTEVTVAGKDATCTETGLTEGKKCSVCNTVTVEQTVVAAKGHTEVAVAGKDATCTETGLTEGKKCSVCDAVITAQETIPTVAHTLETVPAVAATYFAPGNIEHKACSVCSKLFDAEGKELAAADVVIAQLIQVEDNKADVSTDVVDNAIKESETTGKVDIVINVTKDEMAEETTPDDDTTEPAPAPVVTKTELPVESLEKVAEVSSEATLTINMTTATVTLDNKTLEVVAEEAKTSGTSAITLEIEHIETKELNEKQQEAIEDLEVAVTISASILNNGKEIHDFKGGSVTVAVPFTPTEGTKGSDYTVYYVADDGSVTKVPTSYSGGALVFSIGHFSDYIVVNTNIVEEAPPTNGTPETGDTNNVLLLGTVMILSLAMTTVLVTGKKNFTV